MSFQRINQKVGDLEPCPKCGAFGLRVHLVKRYDLRFWYVRCSNCAHRTGNLRTKRQAVKAWNENREESEE